MPREQRFGSMRARLRGRGGSPPEQEAAELDEEEQLDHDVGIPPLSLRDITENRRESVARRLRALRERTPRQAPRTVAGTDPAGPDSPETGASTAASRWQASTPEYGVDDGHRTGSGAGRIAELPERLAGGARALGHGLGTAGHRIADAWHSVPALTRQRITAIVIVAAIAAAVVAVAVPAAPCGAPGGDECPPDDDAIALVPDDALAYAHVDIGVDTEQYGEAAEIASRIPLITRIAIAGASSELGRVDFGSQVRPWAGDELALAVLPGTGRLERVVMIEAEDAEGAAAFASELLGPQASSKDVGGIEVSTGSGGTASAILDGFLLLGAPGALAEIIDRGAEQGTLADASIAGDVFEELPDDRIAYAYVSGVGARALLAGPGLSSLEAFVDSDATAGVGVALSASNGVLELEARSVLDPERTKASPGFFAALPPFEPELPANVGSDALAYLGLGDPGTSVDALLTQAAADAPDLVAAFNRAEADLRRESGITLTDDLLPLLGSELALSVEPVGVEGEVPPPGTLAPSGVPYVSVIASGIDAASAARSLAGLQEPLVEALASSRGARVPGFETAKIAGVDAQSLLVNPDINLTYATYDDRLVIATNPIGVEQARVEGDGLASAPAFEQVTADLPDAVSLLAYLDLRDLLSLGEEIGLAGDPAYATYAPDLRALESAALAVTDDGETIRTDLRIAVSVPAAPEVDPPPLGGE